MSAHVLVEIAVKAFVVLLAAWIATRLMARRYSAAGRHLVWAAALVAVLCLPALVLFGPAWRVAEVPDRWMARAGAAVNMPGARLRADGEVWPAITSPSTHAPM